MDIHSQGRKVVIDCRGRKGNNDSNENWGNKEILINESKVIISRDTLERTIFNELPHTVETDALLVDLGDYKDSVSFELFCNEDEYFFAIEYNYFKIWNELDQLSGNNDSNGYLINWNSDNDQWDKAKAQLLYKIVPKMQILEHISQGNNSLMATLKNKEVKMLKSYSDRDRTRIDNILDLINELRLLKILSSDFDLNADSNKFYFIKGKIDKNQEIYINNVENTNVSSYGRLSETVQNYNTVDKPIAIVVHGVASSCVLGDKELYSDLISFLTPNFHVFTYDYLTIDQTIDDSGRILADNVNLVKTLYPEKKMIVIAHSMGGLVSRAALVLHGAPIDEIIMAGTPNNGSRLGSMTTIASRVLLTANKHRLKVEDTQALVHRKLKGLKDLGNITKYISDQLNNKDIGNKSKYYSIVGDYFGFKTDIIVSNRNMIHINNKKLLKSRMHKVNSTHMDYFKNLKSIENSVGKALETSGHYVGASLRA